MPIPRSISIEPNRAAAPQTQAPALVSVQYLRGGAALAVTAFHALQWCDGGFDVGRAGVDVFFIISGVIMWRITAASELRPADFLARRVTRVAPLYWVATLTVWVLALWWRGFLPEVEPAIPHLLLSLAFIPHFDPLDRAFPTLPPGWTLSYEAVFYLLFAAALCGPRRWRAWVVTAALSVVVLSGFVLADPIYILGANPMLLQFAVGVWLGVAMDAGKLPTRPWGFAGLTLGVAALAILEATHFVDELWRPLLWGAPAALIVAGALTLEARGGVPRWPALVFLGDASYSLYLVHLPATAIVAHTLGYGHPWLFLPVSLAASMLAGAACHLWIETPLIRLVRRISIEKIYREHVINRLDARSPRG